MELNKITISFKEVKGNSLKSTLNANPNTKINDIFITLEHAKEMLKELVNEQAKRDGVKDEEEFFKWLKTKSFRDISTDK